MDVSNTEEVEALFNKDKELCSSLRGIIHTAGVLEDGLIVKQDWSKYVQVMKPKVLGAWNLHRATESRKIKLDVFATYSSVASLFGAAGQSNYAASNSFLDLLAHYRRNLGLAGTSLNWGPWAESGMAAKLDEKLIQRMKEGGIAPHSGELGIKLLERTLTESAPQLGAVRVDWKKFLNSLSPEVKSNFYERFQTGEEKEK